MVVLRGGVLWDWKKTHLWITKKWFNPFNIHNQESKNWPFKVVHNEYKAIWIDNHHQEYAEVCNNGTVQLMRGLGKEYGMGPRYPVVPRFACVRFHILCLKKHQKIFSFDICIFTGTVAGRVNGGKFRCPTIHALQSFEWSYDPAHWKLEFVIEDTYTQGTIRYISPIKRCARATRHLERRLFSTSGRWRGGLVQFCTLALSFKWYWYWCFFSAHEKY